MLWVSEVVLCSGFFARHARVRRCLSTDRMREAASCKARLPAYVLVSLPRCVLWCGDRPGRRRPARLFGSFTFYFLENVYWFCFLGHFLALPPLPLPHNAVGDFVSSLGGVEGMEGAVPINPTASSTHQVTWRTRLSSSSAFLPSAP